MNIYARKIYKKKRNSYNCTGDFYYRYYVLKKINEKYYWRYLYSLAIPQINSLKISGLNLQVVEVVKECNIELPIKRKQFEVFSGDVNWYVIRFEPADLL